MKLIKIKKNIAILTLVCAACLPARAQTRISFARGKSSTVVSGTLGKRGANSSIKRFVVRANAGQHLSVFVKSANKSVYTNVSGETGERGPDMYYTLDADGDHEFIIENVGGRATNFTITVSID